MTYVGPVMTDVQPVMINVGQVVNMMWDQQDWGGIVDCNARPIMTDVEPVITVMRDHQVGGGNW